MKLFVLGAGFSKSFVPNAPLLAQFLAHSQCLLECDEFAAAKRFIENCRFNASIANIETVMTLAEQHDREASEQLRLLLIKVLDKSFQKQPEGNKNWYRFITEHNETLKQFAKYLLERSPRAHVITFNYDVLLENFLELEQKNLEFEPKRFHSGRCYGFHANTWKKDGPGIRWQKEKEHKDHLFVLKLHGSANWPVLANLQFAHRVVIISAHEENLEKRYKETAQWFGANKKALPLIIPPVLDKTGELGHCALAQVWARAANLIQKARRIVFVGYSFPPTDYHAEYLFRVNHSQSCRVDVIDLGGCAGDRERLENRFKDIFGQTRPDFHWGDAAQKLKEMLKL